MDALTLVNDLSRQGVRFGWGSRGMTLTGDLGRLSLDYKHALKENLPAVESLVQWQALQAESVRRFGHQGAALYPFCSLKRELAPVVRTTMGEARVEQVLPNSVRVVLESDFEEWNRQQAEGAGEGALSYLPMVELRFDQVFPPTTPPPESESYR